MMSDRKKTALVLVLGSLLYVLLIVSIPFLKVVNNRSRVWKDYYMLLVSPEYFPEGVDTILAAGGFACISRDNTTISFSDYGDMENVSVSAVESRYLPVDPRVDDYARSLDSYFHTSSPSDDRDIVYVESGSSPLMFARSMRNLLGGGRHSWFIADYNWSGTVCTICLCIAMAASFVFWSSLPKILPLLLAVPWIEFLILGADTGGFGPLLLYASVVTVVEHLRPPILEHLAGGKVGKSLWVWSTGVLALSLVVSVSVTATASGSGYSAAFNGFTLLSALGLAAGYAALLFLKDRGREHGLFIPVTILNTSRRGEKRLSWRRLSVIAMILGCATVLPLMRNGGGGYPIPMPVRYKDVQTFSWQDIAALHGRKKPDSLPDLSDYLTHVAYQEGFMYNREYAFPGVNESITVTRFLEQDKAIFSESDCVKQFTDTWYEDIMANASTHGITGLLLKQDSPSSVMTCEIKKRALIPIHTREQLLVGLIALTPYTIDTAIVRGWGGDL